MDESHPSHYQRQYPRLLEQNLSIRIIHYENYYHNVWKQFLNYHDKIVGWLNVKISTFNVDKMWRIRQETTSETSSLSLSQNSCAVAAGLRQIVLENVVRRVHEKVLNISVP